MGIRNDPKEKCRREVNEGNILERVLTGGFGRIK